MLGYRLKDLREDRELLQRDIAKLLNITQSVYSKYERHEIDITGNYLIILAKFYNTSTDYILGLTNEKKKLYK